MICNVTLYYRTGFNLVDVPASVETLNGMETREYQAIDINQIMFLDTIRIKAKESDISDADYLKITNPSGDRNARDAYYIITGYTMRSEDVASLDVLIDSHLTLGAFLPDDGIVERCSYSGRASASEAFPLESAKRYALNDPLLNQSFSSDKVLIPMYGKMQAIEEGLVEYKNGWDYSASNDVALYGSSYYNVADTPNDDYTDAKNAYSMGRPRQNTTTIKMSNPPIAEDINYVYPGLTFYTADGVGGTQANKLNGILEVAQGMYGYGVSNVITKSYNLPNEFAHVDVANGAAVLITGKYNKAVVKKNIKEILSTYTSSISELFEQYEEWIMYYIFNQMVKIRMMSVASGNETSIPPCFLDLETDENGEHIVVEMTADPSPDGCPYYKIRTVQRIAGAESATFEGFAPNIMYGAIKGATWQEVPVSFTGLNNDAAIRSIQAAMSYSINAANIEDSADFAAMQNQGIKNMFGNIPIIGGFIAGSKNAQNGFSDFKTAGGLLTTGQNLTSSMFDTATAKEQYEYRRAARENAIQSEFSQFVNNNIATDVTQHFPISNTVQSMQGNGVFLEISIPNYYDIISAIQIIQSYGYYYPHSITDFKIFPNLKDYLFIQMKGATFNNKMNKSLREDAANMFNTGVRLWFTPPGAKNNYVKEDA